MHPEIFSAPGSEQFLTAFIEKNCLHFQHDDRERFADLLSWDAINTLMSLNLFDDKRIRVVKDGRPIPLSFYRRESDTRPVDAAKLTDLLNQGASLAINSVNLLSSNVRRITNQLERWLDQKVNVNAYISFGTGGAFTAHYDSHDVLVLQVYGEKDWTLFDDPAPYPMDGSAKPRHADKGRSPLMEVTIRPGEMLFVPRGYVHKAAVKNSTSVHLTFGIHPVIGSEFIGRLRKRCLERDEFRMDIAPVSGTEALAAQELRLKTLLHKMIDEYSFTTFLDELRNEREVLDLFQLGPNREVTSDAVLVPLVRQRENFPLPAKANPDVARPVLDRLMDNNTMKLGALCDSFDGEIEAGDVKTAVDCLIGGRLVAFTQ
ncbi:MAG: cupin domain-containing protein [Novosphingobium sp.]